VYLTIADKELAADFTLQRNREVNIFSMLLLALRFVFALVLIGETVEGSIHAKRMYMDFAGQAWHLLALILSWRYPRYFQSI
jgi:hypothetical protein